MSSDYLGFSVVTYSEMPEDEVILVAGLTPLQTDHITALAQIDTLWQFRHAEHIRPMVRDAIRRAKEARAKLGF